MPAHLIGSQPSGYTSQHDLDQIAGQQREKHLRLGIAKPRIELQHPRALRGQHQPRIQHANKRAAQLCQRVDRRLHHRRRQLRAELRPDGSHRRIRAHAARIRPSVAVQQPFMVLRREHRHHPATIRECQKRHLFALEPLFQHNPRAGCAEDAFLQHRPQGLQCLFNRFRDHHAFAQRQTIGFDYPGPSPGAHKPLRRSVVVNND